MSETPLMKQYGELKAQVPDALLFFRLGDFYELFGADAVEASRLLELTLTSRDKGKENPLPMCGVPHHAAQNYIQRLLNLGKKVALAEQQEEPGPGIKLVRRAIVRVFTPGIRFDLEGAQSSATGLLWQSEHRTVLACLEASTGQTWIESAATLGELLPLVKALRRDGASPTVLAEISCYFENTESAPDLGGGADILDRLPLSPTKAEEVALHHLQLADGRAFFQFPEEKLALGQLIHRVAQSQRVQELPYLTFPRRLTTPDHLHLGPQTATHLDLRPTFELINRTLTAKGSRELLRQLHTPSRDPVTIQERQTALQKLSERPGLLSDIRGFLRSILDLERILGRVHTGLAHPRDLGALRASLESSAALSQHLRIRAEALELTAASILLANLTEQLAQNAALLAPLREQLTAALRDELPVTAREGGIFKLGYHSDLDRLLELADRGENQLVEWEQRERAATGISSLKIRFNRVFGYSIEVTTTHLKSVPSHYIRKQTLAGAERYVTEELKRFEEELLSAQSRRLTLEAELFAELLTQIKLHTPQLRPLASILCEWDVLAGMAQFWLESSGRGRWIFPTLLSPDQSPQLEIQNGRHPLVDAAMPGRFVPNSVKLNANNQTWILTGPNMGGKSTFMRQVALLVILGQCGFPIPAESASWTPIESIFTRIGAHDAIAEGQSTFMVEMTELAHILHHAGPRSLVLLDEIGRGTSTYDGMSVAGASLEWIHQSTKAFTLFATHYHELTQLESKLPGIQNWHLEVAEDDRRIRFLYRLAQGPALRSFGIQVAQMAGLPGAVIDRAWQLLESLQNSKGYEPTSATSANSATSAPAVQPVQPQALRTRPIRSAKVVTPDSQLGLFKL